MNKRCLVIGSVITIIAFLLGFAGVIDVSAIASDEQPDRMIGVYVTSEYLDLFDFEAYLADNFSKIGDDLVINSKDADKYGNRLYAELVSNEYSGENGEKMVSMEYSFDREKGAELFDYTSYDEFGAPHSCLSNSAFSNVRTEYLDSDGSLTAVSLEGTLYITDNGTDLCQAFVNPVYCDAEGRVYAMSGQGMSFSGSYGGETSFTFDETRTVNNEESAKNTVIVHVKYVETPISIKITELDGNLAVLSSKEYSLNEIPDEIDVLEKTEYLMVETSFINCEGKTSKTMELYSESDTYAEVFGPVENGICTRKGFGIKWN